MTGVEAAAVSALVSGTLKVVGNKLAPLLIKEYSSIMGVKEDLQELHDLVEEINFWLEKTVEKSIGSTQSFAWLKKLKDISYDVDDVVDEFQLKAEKHDSNSDGGIMSKYACTVPKSLVFQCKAANKIKAIKKRFSEIVKQRTDYIAITNSLSVGPPVRPTNMRTKEALSLSNVDEELVVGRCKDKKKIISMLEENDNLRKIKIVSIIGLGGSGKTTLAKLIFNDGNIIEDFDIRLWVHVSQEFNVQDLIKKLFEAFSNNNPGAHALPYMTKTISDTLIGKKFLLVLDDVWTNSREEWEEFMVYIKVGAPKSRILLTTRNREVAVIVGSVNQFHLPFLSPDDSWQLFQQSLVTVPTDWDFEFEEVGKAIVDKCGGVPLAIKVLAGALHGKERIEDWQKMRDKNLSHSNVNEKEDRIDACLRLSYFHLPSNLKQCFTICSMFPKGHKIDKEQLIDLWIAHDMITLEDDVDSLDLEYVGHKHFNSLLQVSFLQNVEEEHGRVTCGMHDLVHDLALSILGDEISLDMTNEGTCTTKSYRYLSWITWPEHVAPKNIRKVRAVYMPWYGDYTYAMELEHAKHLRSVMVGYLDTEKANTISQVKYLKYLAMSLRTSKTLPKGITNVWSLQALHVTKSYSLVEIPKSICKLKMLRTLNLSGCTRLKSLPDSIGDCQMISSIDLGNCCELTVLPDSIGKLQKLRTLNLSWCEELKCLPDSIGGCQIISSIDLCNCSKLTVLPDSIGKLQKLRTLNLSWCEELKCLPDSIGKCQMISSIDLCNCSKLTVLPDSIGKLLKLRTLNLSWSKELKCLPDSIVDCQMISSIDLRNCSRLTVLPDSIGKLQKLTTLNLSSCEELRCLPDSFGKCQMISSIDLCNCSKLTVLPDSIGKLQKLRTVNLSKCEELKCLPDSIGDCQMISSIDLCNCMKLTVLPDSIGKLQKLRTLNLSRCEELKCLPDSIGDCQMISSIDLCSCRKLTMLPDSIGRNEKLRVLRLSYIEFQRIPSIITTLRNLECLDLLGCFELVELPESIGNLEKLQVLNLQGCDNLGGMPICIGQLSRLQHLSLFVVGNGEKFAGISELANLSRIGEGLTIKGISNVLDPNGAHMACLKQKAHLQRLYLEWMAYDMEEINSELDQAILDGLEPPSGVEELEVHLYPGRQCARWMQNQVGGRVQGPSPFPFLRVMGLNDFPNLKHLDGLVELPCLEELELKWMPSLESISGGPFPSLMELTMEGLPCLGEVWMVAERAMTNGKVGVGCYNCTPQLRQVRVGNCLTKLEISDCPNLVVKPHLPLSLEELQLEDSEKVLQSPGPCQLKKLKLQCGDDLEGNCWELLQHMTTLESLEISDFSREQLPRTLWSLTSLRSLKVEHCSNIHVLLEWIGELRSLQWLTIISGSNLSSLPHSMGHLTSLQELYIGWCHALQQLPDCLGELCSLRTLKIRELSGLTCLPQSICRLTTSLQRLEIVDCPGITSLPQGIEALISLEYLSIYYCHGIQSLPEGIKGLTALKELQIIGCPDLVRRCEIETGEDWHLISHIPSVRV